jgi:hypothetical protein
MRAAKTSQVNPSHEAGIPLVSLESAKACENLTTSNAKVKWLRPGALRVEYGVAEWPSVHFVARKAYEREDWRGAGGLAVDVANLSAEKVTVCLRVDDDVRADGRIHCRTGQSDLASGERATLALSLSQPPGQMRAGPPLAAQGAWHFDTSQSARHLDISHIVAFQVFLPKPKTAHTLEISNIRLLPEPDLKGIVDKFGQFSRAEWPGKLHEESEFAKRLEEEKTWLRHNPPPADRDEYGGWKDGPQLKATGFFRTALVAPAGGGSASGGGGVELPAPKSAIPAGARWWLVTPTGHLFWSIGVDCVRPHAEGPIRDMGFMFAWLPEEKRKSQWIDFYQINLKRKYGQDWQGRWVDITCERLHSWGFNTIANWSDESIFRARRLPYTVPIHYGGSLPYISAEEYKRKPGMNRRQPDFFDERFPKALDAAVAKRTTEWKDDPWCVGYFVDNELAWDSWAQWGGGAEYLTAREALGAPASLAARRAFVGQLQNKYGMIEKFNAAWGTKAASWDEPIKVAKEQLNDASRADCSAFTTALAERYFSTVAAAMKKHAPKQLYLGCRFAIRPREVVEVAAKY